MFVLGFGLTPIIALGTQIERVWVYFLCYALVALCAFLLNKMLVSFLPRSTRLLILKAFLAIATFAIIIAFSFLSAHILSALFIYLPLLAIDSLLLVQIEAFTAKDSNLESFTHASFQGLLFFLVFFLVALIREFLGSGSITLFSGVNPIILEIPFLHDNPPAFFLTVSGGFIVCAYVISFLRFFLANKKEAEE